MQRKVRCVRVKGDVQIREREREVIKGDVLYYVLYMYRGYGCDVPWKVAVGVYVHIS